MNYKSNLISLSNQLDILHNTMSEQANVPKLTFEEARQLFKNLRDPKNQENIIWEHLINLKDPKSKEQFKNAFLRLKEAFIEQANQTDNRLYLSELIQNLIYYSLKTPDFIDSFVNDKDIKDLLSSNLGNLIRRYKDQNLVERLQNELRVLFFYWKDSDTNKKSKKFELFVKEFQDIIFKELYKLKDSVLKNNNYRLAIDILNLLKKFTTGKIVSVGQQKILINEQGFTDLKNDLLIFLKNNKSKLSQEELKNYEEYSEAISEAQELINILQSDKELNFDDAKKLWFKFSDDYEQFRQIFPRIKKAFIEEAKKTKYDELLNSLIKETIKFAANNPSFIDSFVTDKDAKELIAIKFEIDPGVISIGDQKNIVQSRVLKTMAVEYQNLMYDFLNKEKESALKNKNIIKIHKLLKLISDFSQQRLIIHEKDIDKLREELIQFFTNNKYELNEQDIQQHMYILNDYLENLPKLPQITLNSYQEIKLLLDAVIRWYLKKYEALIKDVINAKTTKEIEIVIDQLQNIDTIYHPTSVINDISKYDKFKNDQIISNFSKTLDALRNTIINSPYFPNVMNEVIKFGEDLLKDFTDLDAWHQFRVTIGRLERALSDKLNKLDSYKKIQELDKKLQEEFEKGLREESTSMISIESKLFKQLINDLANFSDKLKIDEFDIYTKISDEENRSQDNEILKIEALRILGFDLNKKIEKKQFNDILKKRFRKLAVIFHPDKYHGNPDIFKAINQAYEVLQK